jgi:hypothetical protein
VPVGGAIAQVLSKNSGTDYDTGWIAPFSQTATDALYLPLAGGTLTGPLVVPAIDSPSATLFIGPTTSNVIQFRTNNVNRWQITSGALLTNADAATDIGGQVANRPRNIFQAGYLQSGEQTTPATPPANSIRIYPKSDHHLYSLDATGLEIAVGNTGRLAAPVLLTAASGNYTVPAGVTVLEGVMTAAGGGGGGVSAAAATGAAGIPGVMFSFTMAVTPGQVIAFTNGAGGTRGAATGTAGGTGGDSTFGALTAKGGLGGTGSTSGNGATVAQAGTTGGLQLGMIIGSAAVPTAGIAITSTSMTASMNGLAGAAGVGGQGKGIWSKGGTPGTNGSATDADGYGGGASGAGSTTNTAGTGGLGAPGAILLY